MRSFRYRKLLEGAKRLFQNESLHFEMKSGQGIICQCDLEVWQSQKLQAIQKGPSIAESLLQFSCWLQIPSEMMGKRASEIIISKSRRFCLKSICNEDVATFHKIFDRYLKFKSEDNSLLAPIYGLLILHSSIGDKNKWSDSFILMPNLGTENGVIFDIKGYCQNRYIEDRDFKDFHFGKDQNFITSQFIQILQKLPLEARYIIIRKIEANIVFLEEMKIIDYSLLLTFHEGHTDHPKVIKINEKYQLMISFIDFFQVYNERKKLENKFKSIFFKQISSVDPHLYANRMLDFMRKVLLVK